jgi:hypothetical protein
MTFHFVYSSIIISYASLFLFFMPHLLVFLYRLETLFGVKFDDRFGELEGHVTERYCRAGSILLVPDVKSPDRSFVGFLSPSGQ